MTPNDARILYRELCARDPEIQPLFIEVMTSRGHQSLGSFVEAEPDEFVKLVEELKSMLDQTLESADSNVKTPTPAKD